MSHSDLNIEELCPFSTTVKTQLPRFLSVVCLFASPQVLMITHSHDFKQGSVLCMALSLAQSSKELAVVPSVFEMSSQA